MPFDIVEASSRARAREHLGARGVHALVVGCGLRGQLGQMPGESEVALGGDFSSALGEPRRTSGERGELGREHSRGRGLEVRRIAVVPAAVLPPDVAHHELRLVVDGSQIRTLQELLGHAHGVHDVVEPRAFVHHRERLFDERLEELRTL